MNNKLQSLKNNFLEKQRLLEEANKVLKKEFFGIDSIIDNITRSVSSWFALSDIQESPLIINLWGLTGVGKTSLISRLVEILEVKDKFFKFDLSQKGNSQSFAYGFDELCENSETSNVIIVLDEFQHAKTLKGALREEIEKNYNQTLWQLIDTGKVQHMVWKRGLANFMNYINRLSNLLYKGVQVENGLVVSGHDTFYEEFDNRKNDKNPLYFISEIGCDNILDYAGDALSIYLIQDLRKLLNEFNGAETIEFLNKVYKIAICPIEKDFSKSLIFVIGNLDEVYTMSSNFNTEIDADEFYKSSLEITVPEIKNALKQRFRDEQIARLGNIHMIYPALSRNAYKQIIESELNKIASNLESLINLEIKFDKTIAELIYSEGVFPTQGVRPLLTTINHLIKSNLTSFIGEILTKNMSVSALMFRVEEASLVCIYENPEEVHFKTIELHINLETLRKSKKDDMQCITAVHESGHAILSALLLKTLPEVVYSMSSDASSHGFVYSNFQWKYVSRKELIPRVAMFLGGFVAEELVFGVDNVTAGASSDIKKATQLVSEMIKSNGMGKNLIYYELDQMGNNLTYHDNIDVEQEIKQLMNEGMLLAKKRWKEI
tara:strand:+ start:279 stop:2093 length:1815 start_codon:yes stop_codon:yes gene_type:complete